MKPGAMQGYRQFPRRTLLKLLSHQQRPNARLRSPLTVDLVQLSNWHAPVRPPDGDRRARCSEKVADEARIEPTRRRVVSRLELEPREIASSPRTVPGRRVRTARDRAVGWKQLAQPR